MRNLLSEKSGVVKNYSTPTYIRSPPAYHNLYQAWREEDPVSVGDRFRYTRHPESSRHDYLVIGNHVFISLKPSGSENPIRSYFHIESSSLAKSIRDWIAHAHGKGEPIAV